MAGRRRNVEQAEMEEAEPVDVLVPVMPNHDFLKFNNRQWTSDQKKEFKKKRNANLLKPIRAGEFVSWETLELIQGSGDNGLPRGHTVMTEMTSMDYHLDSGEVGFVSYAWPRLFQIVEPIYREMTYEFFSSITFRENMPNYRNDGMVSFQLCGTVQSMSLVTFAVAVGLYTEPETDMDNFDNHLLAGGKETGELNEVAQHWGAIANYVFTQSGASDRFIRNPRHRILHRMISNTITARRESTERVTVADLFYLHSIINGHLLNVPFLLAKYLSTYATGRKKESSICGGQLVTKIARHLGLLTQANVRKCSDIVPGMRELSAAKMVRMGSLRRVQMSYHHGDYTWAPNKAVVPVGGEDARAAMGGRQLRPLEQRIVSLEDEFHDFRDEYRQDRTETRRSEAYVRGLLSDMMGNMHMDYTDYQGERHSFDGQHRYFPQDVPPPQPQFYEQHPMGQYPPQFPSPYGPRYSFHAPAPPQFPTPPFRSDYPGQSSQQGEHSQGGYESYAEGYARGGPRGRFDDPPQ